MKTPDNKKYLLNKVYGYFALKNPEMAPYEMWAQQVFRSCLTRHGLLLTSISHRKGKQGGGHFTFTFQKVDKTKSHEVDIKRLDFLFFGQFAPYNAYRSFYIFYFEELLIRQQDENTLVIRGYYMD